MERKNTEKYLMMFILVAFLIYIGWLIYLFIDVQPVAQDDQPFSIISDSTMADSLANPEADSLLAIVYNAFENQEYDKAREAANKLIEKYPDSPHAEMAARLLEALDPSTSGKGQPPVAQRSSQRPAQKARSTPSARPSTPPPAPVPTSREDEIDALSAQEMALRAQLALEAALAKMRTVREDAEGITWYYNRNVSHFLYKNSFEAYIGRSDAGKIWLRLRIYYTGDKQLTIDTYDIYADDREYAISTQQGNIYRGKGIGGAWEWFDMSASPREYMIVKRVMIASRAAIRYKGSSGTVQRTMTEREKLMLVDVIRTFDALTAQKDFVSVDVAPIN